MWILNEEEGSITISDVALAGCASVDLPYTEGIELEITPTRDGSLGHLAAYINSELILYKRAVHIHYNSGYLYCTLGNAIEPELFIFSTEPPEDASFDDFLTIHETRLIY